MTALLGSETPRLFTAPLHDVTDPAWSLGHRCVAFATDKLGVILDPWQRWFLIHALELNADGSFRFRTVLLLAARQNGKSEMIKALILWAMFTGRAKQVVGTAQDLDIARRLWASAIKMARANPELESMFDGKPRRANGQESLVLENGAEYLIKATTEDAGRGLQGIDLLVLDELRTHKDAKAWGALSKITMARPNAMTIAMSNAGSDESIVLNQLRDAALSGRSLTIGIFEWSAADGCELDDPTAIAQANPSLGRGRLSIQAIDDARASDPTAVYRTEVLCQRVETLDSAVDFPSWQASSDPAGRIGIRDDETADAFAARRAGLRLATCLDVAPDGTHVTLSIATALSDGQVRVEPAIAWRSTEHARAELDAVLDSIGAEVEAWFPSGPAAVFAPIMRAREKALELKGATVAEACMGLADLVKSGRILHSGDPLLDAHIGGSSKLRSGDGWRFTRRGLGNADAAYSAAGAVYVALTMPEPAPKWTGPLVI